MEELGFQGALVADGFTPPRQQQRPFSEAFQAPAPAPFQYRPGRQPQSFGPPATAPMMVDEPDKPRELEDEDGYRSECWSGSTASESSSSDHSPPPSDGAFGALRATGSDWDLLSEMLLDDALGAAPLPPLPATTTARPPLLPSYQLQEAHAPPCVLPTAPAWPQQPAVGYCQRQGKQYEPSVAVGMQGLGCRAVVGGSSPPPPVFGAVDTAYHQPPEVAISPPQRPRTATATVRQKKKTEPAKKPSSATCSTRHSPETAARSRSPLEASASSSSSSASGSPLSGGSSCTAVATTATPDASLSPEELKKLRRRTQIASSVQRHREKKKCVVSALKTELSGLTAQLEALRAQRKDMHVDARLAEWEEAAVTQRRKRKQSEELNARVKKALFQQTTFLMGMRGLLQGGGSGGSLAASEMEFHDWIHSYTVLSARGEASRRRELVAHFSESKMDLAKKLVRRETDALMPRLSRAAPYYASTRVLHDGTQRFVTDPDHDAFVIKQELQALRSSSASLDKLPTDAGDGRVLKKFTSVFLFQETASVTLERLHTLVFESSKGVGVFWPADGYTARAFSHAPVPASAGSSDGASNASNVFYADMTASMSVMDDLRVGADEERDIFVEARVLCRESRDEHEGVIVWDYVDRDDQSGSSGREGPEAARRPRSIRRNCCGAVVVQREPRGMLSVRSISVKMFAPDGEVGRREAAQGAAEVKSRVGEEEEEEEQLRALFRRIGLQATEVERSKEKCTRFVYDAMRSALA